jgi:hypothetical protein
MPTRDNSQLVVIRTAKPSRPRDLFSSLRWALWREAPVVIFGAGPLGAFGSSLGKRKRIRPYRVPSNEELAAVCAPAARRRRGAH